jgi:hypothetical protein
MLFKANVTTRYRKEVVKEIQVYLALNHLEIMRQEHTASIREPFDEYDRVKKSYAMPFDECVLKPHLWETIGLFILRGVKLGGVLLEHKFSRFLCC